jgi:hypothetical protein
VQGGRVEPEFYTLHIGAGGRSTAVSDVEAPKMSKTCTLCQISRLIAISSATLCFAALAALSVQSGVAVPIWVIAGFLVSVVVAFWAVASYLRERQAADLADPKLRGENR